MYIKIDLYNQRAKRNNILNKNVLSEKSIFILRDILKDTYCDL